MTCKSCKKGLNQPLANETICFCRQNKQRFLKITEKPCKNYEKRIEK